MVTTSTTTITGMGTIMKPRRRMRMLHYCQRSVKTSHFLE
jgi:hypothetical protein